MQLPGGMLAGDGSVARDVGLHPITGALELALHEAADGSGRAECIDRMIAAAVTLPVAGADPAALTVGDRQYLMVAIARTLGHRLFWLTGTCPACDKPFDAPLDLDAFPVKPAGAGYPYAELTLPGGALRIRAPTGADQAAIAGIADPRAAVEALARRLIDPQPAAEPPLDEDALEAIDAAAQAVSPEAPQALATACPDCGTETALPFDIAALLLSKLDDPLDDVHEIASAYHWAEADILALPRSRRAAYLDRIARDRGVAR